MLVRNMLASKYKIKKTVFPLLLKKGKVFHSARVFLRVYKKELPCKEPSQFAFVVPKKVVKKATGRNVLKRRGYLFLSKTRQKTKECYLCAFFLKKNTTLRGELQKEMGELLRRAGVLQQDHTKHV